MPTSPTHGVRQNLAFEAAAVAPDGRHLFVGMEGALAQDGPAATLTNGSASRILRYNLASGRLDRQDVYLTDPIAEPPVPVTQFAVSGLVELLPFNDEFMLSMERSFSVGAPGHGEHDQALLGRVPGRDERRRRRQLSARSGGSGRSRRRCCSTCARSGSRSTTSRG